MPGVTLIDKSVIDRTIVEAQHSPRRRKNFNFHPTHEHPLNRLINAFTLGTYVRPHRHIDPPKAEAFIILRGRIGCLIFDDQGKVLERYVLSASGEHSDIMGVDISEGVWHTLVTLSDTAVVFEVKNGPYIPSTDKDFAPWAPAEYTPEAAPYLTQLISQNF